MQVKIEPWFVATINQRQRAICGASWGIPSEGSHDLPGRFEDIGSGTDVFVHIKDCDLIRACQGWEKSPFLMVYHHKSSN
jgi:hypothetical protein